MVEREHDRVAVPLSVILDCTSGKREVRIADLSAGGCYVDTLAPVQPDEVVGLRLLLPHGRTEDIYGTVVYVHQGIGFGVKFHDDMTVDQRRVLKQLVIMNGGKA